MYDLLHPPSGSGFLPQGWTPRASYWGAPIVRPEGLSSLPVTLGGPRSGGYESADFPGCSSPTSNGQLPTLWPGTRAEAGRQARQTRLERSGVWSGSPQRPQGALSCSGQASPSSPNPHPGRPARSVPGIRGTRRTAWAQT